MDLLTFPGVRRERAVEIPASDGTALVADVFIPEDLDRSPALLYRTPYGRAWSVTEAYAPPSWYASRGFAVVCQDVRGCGDSAGAFRPFHQEAADGVDTIAWICDQPWCSGAVGMYGFSYPGLLQLLTAARRPAGLRAIAPAMAASDVHTPWLFRGGAFQLAWVHRWLCDLGAAAAARAGDDESAVAFTMLAADPDRLFGALPLTGVFTPKMQRHIPFLEEWLEHPAGAEYWEAIAPRAGYATIDVPALHITGWYDTFLEGAIENFNRLREAGRAEQMLVAGPWTHTPWQRRSNGVDFGAQASSPVDEQQVAFFRRWLFDHHDPVADRPVQIFVMGENRWRSCDSWPPAGQTLALHLASDGRAQSSGGTGCLVAGPMRQEVSFDAFVVDPGYPVTPPGGRSCCYPAVTPMGPADQQEQHQRNDVLVFATEALARDATIIGSPRLHAFMGSDAVSADLFAQLCVEDAAGRWVNVSDGNVRVDIGDEIGELVITLSPTAVTVPAGRGVRLALSGTAFPTIDRNPHSGVPGVSATASDFEIATHTVFHDARHPSRLELPIADPDMSQLGSSLLQTAPA